jgi:DNA topoisomerase-1
VYAVTKTSLETEFSGKKVILRATGRRLVEAGWRVVLESDQAEETPDEPEAANPVPSLSEGQPLEAASGSLQTKKTRPPARFTEASLIGELKRRGIGRPSTYAATIEGIVSREYVKTEKRQLVPTETGSKIIAVTAPHFSFLDYDFTKGMEDRLDMIAEGKADYVAMMRDSDDLLNNEVEGFLDAVSPKCPDCGKRLTHRVRKETKEKQAYDFWGCSAYPECKASFKNDNGKPGERQANKAVLSEHKCQECGKPLRHFVKEGEGGYNFWGCSGYKEGCAAKYRDDGGLPGGKIEKKSATPSEYKCPKCKKPLYRRQGTSRKTGKDYDFYGCADRACDAIYYPKEDGSPDFSPKKKGGKK